MGRAAILAALLLLSACGREADFDDRYDATAKEIDARAKAMDADIAGAGQAAKADEAKAPQ